MTSLKGHSYAIEADDTAWVSVICTCYNHEAYVEEAIQSVLSQDYPRVELIVIDNASTDRSTERIRAFCQRYPAIQFVFNPVNLGLTRAFNQGLSGAKGHYIIDLSADDVLLPGRITKQVRCFEQLPETVGVVFSNAAHIDANGQKTGYHYPIDTNGYACVSVPTGDVFRAILESSFICTPTMMMRRQVLNELGGYDETLAYEDFDFWVRSSRVYAYAYVDEVLTLKRRLPGSLASQVVQPRNALLPSTLVVCQKAVALCVTPDEYQILARRVQRFIRKAFYAEQFELAQQFGKLHQQIERPDWLTRLVLMGCRLRLSVNWLYQQYLYRKTNKTGLGK